MTLIRTDTIRDQRRDQQVSFRVGNGSRHFVYRYGLRGRAFGCVVFVAGPFLFDIAVLRATSSLPSFKGRCKHCCSCRNAFGLVRRRRNAYRQLSALATHVLPLRETKATKLTPRHRHSKRGFEVSVKHFSRETKCRIVIEAEVTQFITSTNLSSHCMGRTFRGLWNYSIAAGRLNFYARFNSASKDVSSQLYSRWRCRCYCGLFEF